MLSVFYVIPNYVNRGFAALRYSNALQFKLTNLSFVEDSKVEVMFCGGICIYLDVH